MTDLARLLKDQGMTSVVVIDDGYDAIPKASDIDDQDAWAVFFADVGEMGDLLRDVFPAYDDYESERLQTSDEFVRALWDAQARFPPGSADVLFTGYLQATATDRRFLTDLEARLTAVGLQVVRSGRVPPEEARDAQLVFADLFLGAAQQDADIDLSLTALKPILKDREREPPCVVLMSRSPLLGDKKERFRDQAGLLGAMFRAYAKTKLLEGPTLESTLERLATHRTDALRVARFVHGWKASLRDASDRFMKSIGRLDLSDYAQIRDVLLAYEGQPLGSYMLDVFDRVLAHEIEGDATIVDAAQELNGIDPARYPAPHIAGSSDLQDLVFRTIWQNPKRLGVSTTVDDIPVGFGDVLVRRDLLGGAEKLEGPDAYVVMTPACDLVRKEGAKRVLLLSGDVEQITPRSWTYGKSSFKTPIMKLPDDKRVFVRWDAKDISTLTKEQITSLLAADGRYKLHLRLREAHALELQQRLLAEMGRIGLVANMPATFPVQVEVYFHGTDGLRKFDLEAATRDGGVCYIGRDEEGKEQTRLVMTEEAIDGLLAALAALGQDDVHQKVKAALAHLKADESFPSILERGLPVPRSEKPGFAPIRVKVTGQDSEREVSIGCIGRNPTALKPDVKFGIFAMVVTDADPGKAIARDEAEAEVVMDVVVFPVAASKAT